MVFIYHSRKMSYFLVCIVAEMVNRVKERNPTLKTSLTLAVLGIC